MNAGDANPIANEHVQSVMQDILAIRRSITSYQMTKDGQIGETTLRAKSALQVIGLVLLSGLISIEVFGNHLITRTMLANAHNRIAGIIIASTIGAFLALCLGIMYFVICKAAAKTQENLDSYIKRNFVYLQNLSHISDLAVKFTIIAALIIGGRPDWVAPFLLIFTADYLVQGRFFTLSLRLSQLLAMLTAAGAASMFYFGISEVLWPMLWYFFVTAVSVTQLYRMKRVED